MSLIVLGWWSAGCAEAPLPGVHELDAPQRLTRASMMLLGRHPTPEELAVVAERPEALWEEVDAMTSDAAFGETIRELTDHAWRMQTEALLIPASGSLSRVEMARIRTSLWSAPGRLVERVVLDDRPFTEIVTADWFVADAVVASAWPDVVGFDYDAPNDWQVVTWGDGRPAAGVLSDSSLWTRFRSPNVNFNRRRANALSSALLCHDFLEAQTTTESLALDLSDPDITNDAVTSVPACVGCHQDLDALAGFFPFEPFWFIEIMTFPYAVYDASYADEWTRMTGRPPMYFGLGGGDLADLGRYVADDPRFWDCTARRFYGWFAQMPPEDVPVEIAVELTESFVASGFDAKALARDAALHPTLAGSHSDDALLAGGVRGYLTASPRQLARTVEAMTGFRWEVDVEGECCGAQGGSAVYGTVELPTDQYVGYDVVGGGFDGDSVVAPKRTPSVGGALLQQRLAEHAAAYVVDEDSSVLLPGLDLDEVGEGAVRARLSELHLRVLGEDAAAEGDVVDETWDLWSSVQTRTGSPARAWKVVITAMLRDVRVTTY